jgi:hypothetical protein
MFISLPMFSQSTIFGPPPSQNVGYLAFWWFVLVCSIYLPVDILAHPWGFPLPRTFSLFLCTQFVFTLPEKLFKY